MLAGSENYMKLAGFHLKIKSATQYFFQQDVSLKIKVDEFKRFLCREGGVVSRARIEISEILCFENLVEKF